MLSVPVFLIPGKAGAVQLHHRQFLHRPEAGRVLGQVQGRTGMGRRVLDHEIRVDHPVAAPETLSLGGRALQIADTLDQSVARFEERVVNRLDTVSGSLDARSKDFTDQLEAKSGAIVSAV